MFRHISRRYAVYTITATGLLPLFENMARGNKFLLAPMYGHVLSSFHKKECRFSTYIVKI